MNKELKEKEHERKKKVKVETKTEKNTKNKRRKRGPYWTILTRYVRGRQRANECNERRIGTTNAILDRKSNRYYQA